MLWSEKQLPPCQAWEPKAAFSLLTRQDAAPNTKYAERLRGKLRLSP
jgi:hypothetical protein